MGVDLLKKGNEDYHFSQTYQIQPVTFKLNLESDKVHIVC